METNRELQFRIVGLDCMEEVALLRQVVGPIVGGDERLSFDVLQGRLSVDTRGTAVTTSAVMEAVARTGMRAEIWSEERNRSGRLQTPLWTMSTLWMMLSGICLAAALAIRVVMRWHGMPGGALDIARLSLDYGAIIAGLPLIAPKALRAAMRFRADMNLLLCIAVFGAIVIGEHLEAASVVFLFVLAEALEAWSVRRAHRAIRSLLELSPPTARVVNEDRSELVQPIEKIPVRSRIIVKPGERIPLDGMVMAGISHVNQAPITGESLPIEKRVGDPVFAGSVNGHGALEVETTKVADDTTVAHIVRMVDEAQKRRAPIEQWVEKFAHYYTPYVILLSLLVFLLPPLLFNAPWHVWFYRSLVLLVIACPCALVISTPVSVVAALAAAARHGVLIKSGATIEIPAQLRAIAFDKTGTITEGHPSVRLIVPLNGHTSTELLERAASLEARSDHPMARAIIAHARSMAIDIQPAEDYQELPGQGASGRWRGERYWLGSARLLRERGETNHEVDKLIAQFADQGHTVVVVGNDRHVCGLFALADTLRPTAITALSELKELGIAHLVVLTGDNWATARAISQEVGIDEFHAELLPDEKATVVEQLVTRYQRVAMIGDGVNDAPALAKSTLGIAMGVAGSDAAIETADIALMSNDLTKLAWTIRLSRRTRRIIRQNIWFSLMVKVAFALLTFVGFASLWGAIAADMGASFLVILNGLRLLRS